MYDRLTRRMSDGTAVFAEKSKSFYSAQIYEEAREKNAQILDRLCELEDKICEGKIVELPCAVGQTVFAISESKIEECHVDEICIYGNEKIVMTEHTCDYDCKGCPFNSWGQDYSGEHSCKGEYGVYSFAFEDFGKTVFLTEAEANKKLKELGNEKR